ncbi:MAG: hypothetical protein CMJ19_06915 [Phycisphaeraceae bacterium]|nr:hypothetical protein [Phycisphaeraceae bacterium]
MRHGFMPRIDEELARVSARNQYKLIYRYFRKYRKRVIPELYVLSVLFVTLGLYSGGINNSSTLGIFSLHISLLIIFFIKLVLIDAQAYNFFKQHLRSSVLECTHCERVIKWNEPWLCAHCKESQVCDPDVVYDETGPEMRVKTLPDFTSSFLYACGVCQKEPLALQCPECHQPIPMTDGDIKSPSWWARLASDTYIHTDESDESNEDASEEPQSQIEIFKKRINYKIQNAIDLQKAKEDLLLEAKEIKSPRERKRVIENINAAVDDIEYFNEQ